MDQGLTVVIGMSISYVASLVGMLIAWRAYRKRKGQSSQQGQGGQ